MQLNLKPESHGQIKCGTLSVANLQRSLSQYQEYLGYTLIESGTVDTELAEAWQTPQMAGAKYALLQAASGADSYLRLIEVPAVSNYIPATTYGWGAFEICVQDVFGLAESLKDSDFTIIGPPKLVDGFTSFIPMQVMGPDGEILFLNQVNHSDHDADLPKAQSKVDKLFIVVLASPDRDASVNEYQHRFGFDRAATHTLRYSLLNRAFELSPETQHQISMLQKGRMTIAQVDQYPEQAGHRPCHAGYLPPGNAMVTLMVNKLSELNLPKDLIEQASERQGVLYQGRKSLLLKGLATELIELIEIG